jgi:hypothetical protein
MPAVLSGCTLFLYYLAPDLFAINYERDESVFVFTAVPQDNDVDYSFPVTGSAAHGGVIRYEYIPAKPFSLFRERELLDPPLTAKSSRPEYSRIANRMTT